MFLVVSESMYYLGIYWFNVDISVFYDLWRLDRRGDIKCSLFLRLKRVDTLLNL